MYHVYCTPTPGHLAGRGICRIHASMQTSAASYNVLRYMRDSVTRRNQSQVKLLARRFEWPVHLVVTCCFIIYIPGSLPPTDRPTDSRCRHQYTVSAKNFDLQYWLRKPRPRSSSAAVPRSTIARYKQTSSYTGDSLPAWTGRPCHPRPCPCPLGVVLEYHGDIDAHGTVPSCVRCKRSVTWTKDRRLSVRACARACVCVHRTAVEVQVADVE